MRPIDAEPIEKFIEDGLNNPDKLKAFGHDAIEILTEIHFAHTIDPASLRPKGGWITMSYWKKRRGHHVQYVVKKCSLCNFRVKARWDNNFCPNCGADMRGE